MRCIVVIVPVRHFFAQQKCNIVIIDCEHFLGINKRSSLSPFAQCTNMGEKD